MAFRPWFVDKAFQNWHASYNFTAVDYISLRLDIVIWLVCSTTAQPASILQLLTALCCASGLLALAVHWRAPAFYMRHRTAITAARRVLTLPYIRHAANKKMNPRGPVAAVVLHLLVQSGALHNFAGSLFFLDGWRVGSLTSLVGLAAISSAAGPSCSQLLNGPHAESAAWHQLAAALDKAAGGVFRHSLQQLPLAGAVCRTTATSMQTLLACASVCATFLIERGYRLRFKQQQLPAAVAALQDHIYVLPWWLEVPQVLLVLWVSTALTWLAAGAWYGLMGAAA
ncbi:hypothetical protein COO60DRAFT_1680067 [Scenedesmus sp. NREL 46B-D3]|nr:hypothetical protein COO60DRAFT_1680067 [Scenedesmus sp. NREL 46B-D3]